MFDLQITKPSSTGTEQPAHRLWAVGGTRPVNGPPGCNSTRLWPEIAGETAGSTESILTSESVEGSNETTELPTTNISTWK